VLASSEGHTRCVVCAEEVEKHVSVDGKSRCERKKTKTSPTATGATVVFVEWCYRCS